MILQTCSVICDHCEAKESCLPSNPKQWACFEINRDKVSPFATPYRVDLCPDCFAKFLGWIKKTREALQ